MTLPRMTTEPSPMIDYRAIVGHNIALARRQNGINQEVLAKHLRIRRPHLSDWERGVIEPTHANLQRVADHLHRPFAWFYVDRRGDGEDAAA